MIRFYRTIKQFSTSKLLAITSLLLLLTACSESDSNSSQSAISLTLGESKTVHSAEIQSSGAVINVDDPDSPIDGMEITIPSGAYGDNTDFTIAYSPITSHSGNEYIDPVTPLISVENGGDYSDEIISVKIPLTMEEGYHYMAFYYDETSGAMEGIPELSHDEESLTIATRHFSKIMINRIALAKAFIFGAFESDYKVKQDNWQFDNYGSYLSPGGICSGMSITSLYYFDKKKPQGGYSPLYNSYENGSTGFGYDDEQAIKVASTAQYYEDNFQDQSYDYWYNLGREKNDMWTYFMFVHSIALTREPQYVSIYPSDGSAGHALVVYKKAGNGLYVADPNLPDDDTVKIEFEWDDEETYTSGQFKPFESQWNSGSDKIDFTEVFYIGKTAVVNWADLDELWQNLESNTAGEDFPEYELKIIEKDTSGIETEALLTEGYKTNNSVVKIKVDTREFNTARINVRYEDIMLLENHSETVEVNLVEGSNKLGFYVEAEVYSDVTKKSDWTWTDFQYVTIEYEETNTVVDGCVIGEWSYYSDNACQGNYQTATPWSITDDGKTKLNALHGTWSISESELTILHPVDPRMEWKAQILNSCNLLEGVHFYDDEQRGCWQAIRD